MRLTGNVRYPTADCSSSPQLCPQDSCSPSPAVRSLTHLYTDKVKLTLHTDSSFPHVKPFHQTQNQRCVRELADEKPCDYITAIFERTGNKLKLFPSLTPSPSAEKHPLPARRNSACDSRRLLPVHSPGLLPGTCKP